MENEIIIGWWLSFSMAEDWLGMLINYTKEAAVTSQF